MVYKIKVFGFIILRLDHEKAGQGGFLKRPEGETLCGIVCVATFFCRKFCFLSPTHEVAETKPPTRNGKGRKLFSFLGIPRGNWKMFASGLRRGNLSLHTCAAPRPPAPSSSGATVAWPAGRAPVASGGGGGGALHRATAPGTSGVYAPAAHPGTNLERLEPGVPPHPTRVLAREPGLRLHGCGRGS